MASSYYKPCRELDICNELIDKYFKTKQYDKRLWHNENLVRILS